jgi:uncharacterized protein YdeI (YjbR/CyaY-like superfamily)
MKVPYAKKWQKEIVKLCQIELDCDLIEELKWGKPCFTFQKKNVAIVIPPKESCASLSSRAHRIEDVKKHGDSPRSNRDILEHHVQRLT